MNTKRLTKERETEIREKVEQMREWGYEKELLSEIDALKSELDEQCRINGMGGSRELRLMTEKDILKRALEAARTQLSMYKANHSVQKCDEALDKVK